MIHDPSEYIRQLQQLLISDKKKVAFLFGAGTSLAKKSNTSKVVPAIATLTQDIVQALSATEKYRIAFDEIKSEIGEEKYTIESLLSNVEQKRQIIGNGNLNGLNKNDFDELIKLIKIQIREKVSIHNKTDKNVINLDSADWMGKTEWTKGDFDELTKEISKQIKEKETNINGLNLNDVIHIDFADWIGKADRKFPIEIFTTNYDYLFELALEYKNVPFYDGFTGSFKPFFNADSVDDLNFLSNQTKLWKIHGSLGWHFDEETKKVWRKDSDNDDILIYPSTLKYNDSKKQPYTALGDRLTNFLRLPDTVLIICGYSFGDEHINERITTALNSNTSSHVYVLYYDIVWKDAKRDSYSLKEDTYLAKLAKANSKISVWGCRNAVIGCQYGSWKLKREPDKDDAINIDLYFDADGPTDKDDPLQVEKKGDQIWTGEGELKIPDFKSFVDFLQSMIISPNINQDSK